MPLLNLEDHFLFASQDGKISINLNQLIDPTQTIENMALAPNKVEEIKRAHKERITKGKTKKETTELDQDIVLSQVSFFKGIKAAVEDQKQTIISISKEPNERGGDDLTLVFDAQKSVDEIEKLLLKLYPQDPNAAKKEINPRVKADFERKYSAMKQEITEGLFEEDGTTPKAGLAEDAEDLAKYRMAAWLNEQLSVLRVLDEKQEAYNQSEAQLKAMVAAETKGGAAKPNIASIADGAMGKGRKDPVYSYPTFFWQGEKKDSLIAASKAKHELDNARAAFVSSLNNESRKASDLQEAAPYYEDVADAKYNAMAGRARYFYHPFLKGLLTSTNVTKTSDWKDISDFRNKLISQLCNTSEFNPIRSQLEKLLDDKDRGLLNDADFDVMFKFVKSKVDKADEAQKKYLEALEEVVRDLNKKILNKIDENESKGDELNKLRLLQAFLILSPFMPISVAPALFSAIAPAFHGVGIADFAASMFSVTGPFGQFAIITDSLGIDNAVGGFLHLFDGLWSLPETILQSTPIASLFNSLSAVSSSPILSGLIPALMVEAYSNFTTREIEYRTAKGKIKADAKKELETAINKLKISHLGDTKKLEKEFLEEKIVKETQLETTANIFDFFARQYASNPGATSQILKQLLGDKDGEKISKLFQEILNNPDPEIVKAKRSELGAIIHSFNDDPKGKEKLDALLKLTITDPEKLYDSVLTPIKEAEAAVSIVTSLTTTTPPDVEPTKITEIFNADGTVKDQYKPRDYSVKINYLGKDVFFSLSSSGPDFNEKLKILQALDGVRVPGQVTITENGASNSFDTDDLFGLVSSNFSRSKGDQDVSIQDLFENGEIKPDVALRVHNISLTVMGEERFITIAENDPKYNQTLLEQLRSADGAQARIEKARGEIAGLPLVAGRDLEQQKELIKNTAIFESAESNGVAHDFLPVKQERLLWSEVSTNLIASREGLQKAGIVFYNGSNFDDRHNTEENLNRMLLLEYLSHPDNRDKVATTGYKYGDMFDRIVAGTIGNHDIEDFISDCGMKKSEQKQIVEASRLGIKEEERDDRPQTKSILNQFGLDRAELLMVKEHYYLEKTDLKDPATGKETSEVDRRRQASALLEQEAQEFVTQEKEAMSEPEKADPNLTQRLVAKWLSTKVDEVKREYDQALTDEKSILKKSVVATEKGIKDMQIKAMNTTGNLHAQEAMGVQSGRRLSRGDSGEMVEIGHGLRGRAKS